MTSGAKLGVHMHHFRLHRGIGAAVEYCVSSARAVAPQPYSRCVLKSADYTRNLRTHTVGSEDQTQSAATCHFPLENIVESGTRSIQGRFVGPA